MGCGRRGASPWRGRRAEAARREGRPPSPWTSLAATAAGAAPRARLFPRAGAPDRRRHRGGCGGGGGGGAGVGVRTPGIDPRVAGGVGGYPRSSLRLEPTTPTRRSRRRRPRKPRWRAEVRCSRRGGPCASGWTPPRRPPRAWRRARAPPRRRRQGAGPASVCLKRQSGGRKRRPALRASVPGRRARAAEKARRPRRRPGLSVRPSE